MTDISKLLNETAVHIKPSGIRKFFDIAEKMDDVISLGVGEPDFPTPWHIREAGIKSLERAHTRYTGNRGMAALLVEISKFMNRKYNLNYDADTECMVTVGGSEAIDACIRSVLSAGDEVIIPEPSFVCYKPITELAGGTPIIIETKRENNFTLTADELKAKITNKTKLLILPFPNNPTGAVMREKDLLEIAEVLRGTDILVLSDEIYSELTYGSNRHVSIAEIDGMKERTIVVNGFSKTYSMTGWRLGFACGPKPVIDQMLKIHQYAIMCSPTTSQYAGIEALKNGDDDINAMLKEYNIRRRLVVSEFRKMGLDCFEPEGAFYVFPSIKSTGLDSYTFSQKLLSEKQIAVVPGNAFGDCGEGYIRVSYCNNLSRLQVALRKIKEFVSELSEEK